MSEEQKQGGAPIVPDISRLSPEKVRDEMHFVMDALESTREENGCVTFGSGARKAVVLPEGIDNPENKNITIFVVYFSEIGFRI